MSGVAHGDEHLGELLSAHLDGELSPEETAEVEAHLGTCAACRADLDATGTVRTALRDAPAIDPPFGFYERLLRPGPRRVRQGRAWRAGVAAIGIAALWVVGIGLISDPRDTRETPQVDGVRAALAAPALRAGGGGTADIELPFELDGLRRGPAITTRDGGTLVIFGDSPRSWIGVQTTPGHVDWSKLTGGLRGKIDGIPGEPWRSVAPGVMPAIVYESNGVGVTIAGPVELATLESVARQLPAPGSPSVTERLVEGLRATFDGW